MSNINNVFVAYSEFYGDNKNTKNIFKFLWEKIVKDKKFCFSKIRFHFIIFIKNMTVNH